MPLDIYLVNKGWGLIPASHTDADEIARFEPGAIIKARITKDRSPALHRFYWAMVDKVASGIGYDKDALSDDLLITAQRVDSYLLSNGWTRVRAKRISRMDHYSFVPFVQQAIDIILQDYLPGIRRDELLKEIEEMLGIGFEEAIEQDNARRNNGKHQRRPRIAGTEPRSNRRTASKL